MLYTGASQALVDEVIREFLVSLVLIALLAVVVVALVLIWIVGRNITRPITAAAGVMQRISELDFTDNAGEDSSKILERDGSV